MCVRGEEGGISVCAGVLYDFLKHFTSSTAFEQTKNIKLCTSNHNIDYCLCTGYFVTTRVIAEFI